MQEVKFKNSEAGVIPEEWHDPQIGDLLKVGHGKDYKQLNQGNIPVYGTGGYMTSVDQFLYDGPTVCIGRKGTIDKPIYHEGKIWTVDTLFYTHSFKNCDPKFLYYAFQRVDWMSFNEGTTVPSLTATIIENINVAVPKEKTEQEEISKAISDIEDYVSILDEVIAKKINIRAGAIQDLLSGKIRLIPSISKLVETEIGYLPEDWGEPVALDSIGSWSHGSGVKRDDAGSGSIPCIRYGEIYTTHHDYIKEIQTYISQEVADTAKLLKKGDILFAASGETKEEIAKAVAFVGEIPTYAGGDIIILSPKDDYDPMYLGYVLNIPVVNAQKAERGQGDAVVHIHKEQLASVVIPVPSTKDEQHLIAQTLSDMDAEIQALEEEKEKYINIKQGMMQQLLTGNIRLI